MGCGKSKHDVASGNTVLHRKKSSVDSKAEQENGTETKDTHNNNVDNQNSQVAQNNNENVKEVGVGGKCDESNVVVKDKAPEIFTNVQEDKALEKSHEADAAENKTEEVVVVAEEASEKPEGGKDDSLKKNAQEVNDASPAADEKQPAEEKKAEIEKEDASLKEEALVKEEETKDTNQEEALDKEEETKETVHEETLAKEEETKVDANVSTSEGDQKDLKAEQGQ
ncbi:hypothetical protein SESBI_09936 [Sesbania bispinosa]|nr:hypothetical protein SESBI_09934 [Sesbania bispinosa]KAJ1427271.1 hypothetical protein SESBI_09936 [Sesbania bispinosa]